MDAPAMNDRFHLGAHWRSRAQACEESARRLAQMLREFGDTDPVLSTWYRMRKRLRDPPRAIPTSESELRAILRRSRLAEEEPMEWSTFSAWYCQEDPGGLMLFCGAGGPRDHNSCVLNLPDARNVLDRLTSPATFGRLAVTIIRAWEPDWFIGMSSLEMAAQRSARRYPLVGWLTYIARSRGEVPAEVAPCRTMAIDDLGTLIVLTEDRFDAMNPAHVAEARRIADVLDRAGLRWSWD